MQHVFVYGTLLFPEILEGLTGRTFSVQKAELYNFKRLRVAEGDYPAIIAAEGESVSGMLVLNVDARSMELLRFYEGEDYDCRKLEVKLKKQSVFAHVFTWNNDPGLLTESDWNLKNFEQHFLQDYIRYVVPETVAEFTKLFS
ncbi:gamma-glutamylcyclotransferase family protein [Maribellus sediminis]|uniref:gamma-glutamylcyclotransferase family protein n=1 Tax=Maribellus sediminis TaxID=2696285 RepID=UPI001431C23D|nr:gamma-glutamylcyclotransferase family protein [Maribellus sediminis]